MAKYTHIVEKVGVSLNTVKNDIKKGFQLYHFLQFFPLRNNQIDTMCQSVFTGFDIRR